MNSSGGIFYDKDVELLNITTKTQRKKALKNAGYSAFLLNSDVVYFDLLTGNGTNVMKDRQSGCLDDRERILCGKQATPLNT